MNRSRALRSSIGLIGLAAAVLGRTPASTTPASSAPATPTPATHQAIQGHVLLYGTLAALRPATRTGDLALPDGTLLPLRFTLVAQLRGLRVGDELAVGVEAHDHARLLVRMLERQSFSKHWRGDESSKHWRSTDFSKHWRVQGFSKHWRNDDYSKHWRVHGVVARTLGHGDAEILGINGAATVLHVAGASITGAGAAASSAGVAYADSAGTIRAGAEIDAQVTLTGAATVTLSTARIVAPRVKGMDVEGRVTAVDRPLGTLTITDENGQPTKIVLGPRVTSYSVGQGVEAWGSPSGGNVWGAATTLTLVADTTLEREDPVTNDGAQDGGSPTVAASPGDPTSVAPSATVAPAFIIPVGTPAANRDEVASATPAFVIPVAPSPTVGAPTGTASGVPATASATAGATIGPAATPSATNTSTVTPPGSATPPAGGTTVTSTSTPTMTRSPMVAATATWTSTPAATPTDTSTPTPTDSPAETATATPTDTSTPTASATATATPTASATATATPTASATATATPTATSTPTGTASPTPSPTAVSVVQNLQASFNNKGVDNDGVTPGGGAADTFDEGGQSYSAQALASPSNRTQPLTPGARFAYNGVSFQWPSPGPGSANNVKATGQTINLTQISGTKIAFLGAACDNGSIPITGTMTVNYTNMSAQTVALAFDDWSHDPSTGPYKIARNSVVTDMPYRDNGSGAQMLTTHVYYTELPLDPTRTVKSITLPPDPAANGGAGYLHVFAATIVQ